MKRLLFLSLFIIIVVSILYVSSTMADGFTDLVIPQGLPPRETVTTGDYKAYMPLSTTLLSPPPGGVASVNTLPYKDPELEKAPYARLKNVLETANGFVQNEAIHMEEMSDPSIQLPLTTLKADIRRLKDEVLVLQRIPGIDSTLTQGAVDGMEANLAYLQKKWRASPNSMVEGFDNAPGSTQRCTVAELNDLLVKIGVEITRLSASATTDPVTTQRIATLTSIKGAVQDIVTKVSSGQMAATDIPILESDYLAFLPVLGTDTALPSLLKGNNLPPSLSSLFTSYQAGDISGAGITQYLFQNYADTFFKGLSWDLQMNYTAERTQAVAEAKKGYAEAVVKALAPYRGEFASATMPDDLIDAAPIVATTQGGSTTGTGTTGTGTTGTRSTGTGAAAIQDGAPAATLDWKDRSTQICTAIQNRGLEPGDFGCLTDTSAVGKGFSWRGYAKMVCTRLGTVYDTSAPEACGCPPLTWSGWRL